MGELPRMYFGKTVDENLKILSGENFEFDYSKEPTFSEVISFPNITAIPRLLIAAEYQITDTFFVECDVNSALYLVDEVWAMRNMGVLYKVVGKGSVAGVFSDSIIKSTMIILINKSCLMKDNYYLWNVTNRDNKFIMNVVVGKITTEGSLKRN